MNIAQEIYESIQELYQEIIKVDLKTGKATILHSITDPSDRGKECIWDSQLEKYMKNKIQPSDHERMRDNFCLRHLRNECEKGKGLFSNNFSTMNGKLPDNHVTVLAFAPGNDSQEKVYILLRKAGQEYFMWSIANQYVSSTCDYFIYLDAKHNSYQMFSSRAGTPLPPVICNDYEGSKIEYVRKYVVEEDQEMVMREMQISRIQEVLEHNEVHSFTCGIMEHGGYKRKRLDYSYYDKECQMILFSRTDVTNVYLEEQKKSQRMEELLLKAQTDPLTKICNFQATFDAISEKLTDTDDNYAFCFVDLDNFKQINDTMGHLAGDEVLRQVADVLKDVAGPENLVGRVGGGAGPRQGDRGKDPRGDPEHYRRRKKQYKDLRQCRDRHCAAGRQRLLRPLKTGGCLSLPGKIRRKRSLVRREGRTGEYIKKRPRAAGKAALGRFCGALQIIPHPEAFQKRQILTAGPDHRQEPV